MTDLLSTRTPPRARRPQLPRVCDSMRAAPRTPNPPTPWRQHEAPPATPPPCGSTTNARPALGDTTKRHEQRQGHAQAPRAPDPPLRWRRHEAPPATPTPRGSTTNTRPTTPLATPPSATSRATATRQDHRPLITGLRQRPAACTNGLRPHPCSAEHAHEAPPTRQHRDRAPPRPTHPRQHNHLAKPARGDTASRQRDAVQPHPPNSTRRTATRTATPTARARSSAWRSPTGLRPSCPSPAASPCCPPSWRRSPR